MKKNLYLIKLVGEPTPVPILADGYTINPASGILMVYDVILSRETESHISILSAAHGHWAHIRLVDVRDV